MFKCFCKNKKSKVIVIRLSGVIGKVGFNQGLNAAGLKYLEKAKKHKNAKAIAIIINSPGGSPVQSELICKKISQLSKEIGKSPIPIYSFCEDVAASGGYFLATMGKEIYASNSSIIGSIGVISQGFGFNNAIKKLGIERRIISQGDNKSVLDPFSSQKKEDIEIVKEIQHDIHQEFIKIVKDSRKKRLKAADKVIFNGRFWSGKQALKLGLIDGIGEYSEICKKKFGKDTSFIEISPNKSFLQKKFSSLANITIDKISERLQESIFYNRFFN
jgi:signal peptide peptidase SppA